MCYYSLEKEITGVYDDDTILALYAFQLANRILGEDASYELRWFFGPSTRAKMNACGRLCVMEK